MLAEHVRPAVKAMPPARRLHDYPNGVDVRFHQWDSILATKPARTGYEHRHGLLAFFRGVLWQGRGKVSRSEADTRLSPKQKAAHARKDVVLRMARQHKAKVL